MTPSGHKPVLLNAATALLLEGGRVRFMDATFGGGGHTRALLSAGDAVSVDALDQDPEAAARAQTLAAEFGPRFRFFDTNFRLLDRVEPTDKRYDGILFDLGVSSFQLDTASRGFSFRTDAPADMRLDPRKGLSAADFLETASHEDLVRAVRDFGEEPRWKRVVKAIEEARGTGRLARTLTLAALVEEATGPHYGPRRIHPATKVFQGLRIAVNEELAAIEEALPKAFARLSPGGLLAVITFHSLEDRIVKRFCNRMAGRPEDFRDSTAQQDRVAFAQLVWRRPLTADESEISENPRSRSAKLRALRKLEDAA